MSNTTEAPAQCRRCKRHALRTPASRAAGIGARCAAIEAAFAGLSDKQADKARQLIIDKGIVKVRAGIYKMTAEGGEVTHTASVNGNCTCEWGIRRTSATKKTCYHVAVAVLFDKPRRPLRRSDLAKAA
jgi:hypothetical protein